jgi:hypothetical protein
LLVIKNIILVSYCKIRKYFEGRYYYCPQLYWKISFLFFWYFQFLDIVLFTYLFHLWSSNGFYLSLLNGIVSSAENYFPALIISSSFVCLPKLNIWSEICELSGWYALYFAKFCGFDILLIFIANRLKLSLFYYRFCDPELYYIVYMIIYSKI